MNISSITNQLKQNKLVIKTLLGGLSAEQYVWKPAENSWSLLEIISHLLDEEKEDFRQRIKLTLAGKDKPFPPIDPHNWPQMRNYLSRNYNETLSEFSMERDASIGWLQGLESPNWNDFREHPIAGKLYAGDLLISWVVHDLIHISQITRCISDYLETEAQPYSSGYAKP